MLDIYFFFKNEILLLLNYIILFFNKIENFLNARRKIKLHWCVIMEYEFFLSQIFFKSLVKRKNKNKWIVIIMELWNFLKNLKLSIKIKIITNNVVYNLLYNFLSMFYFFFPVKFFKIIKAKIVEIY